MDQEFPPWPKLQKLLKEAHKRLGKQTREKETNEINGRLGNGRWIGKEWGKIKVTN